MNEQSPKPLEMRCPTCGSSQEEHPIPSTTPVAISKRTTEALQQPTQERSHDLAELSRHIHGYTCAHIQFADQKAGFLFAFAGAILAYEFQKQQHFRWIKDITSWSAFDSAAFLSMFSLSIAEILAVSVVLPRLKTSHRGSIFFGSIAAHNSAEEYASHVCSLAPDEASRELLKHTHDLSRICRTKYTVLSAAIWFALVGTIGGIIALLA